MKASAHFRERIVKDVRDRVNRFFLACGNNDTRGCLYHSFATVERLKQGGYHAVIQAGSAFWPRTPLDQDDGVASQFGYEWQGDIGLPEFRQKHVMPEMHVWAAARLDSDWSIIDLTTSQLIEQCKLTTGLDWPGPQPPDYFWEPAQKMPRGIHYLADARAIDVALEMLNRNQRAGLPLWVLSGRRTR